MRNKKIIFHVTKKYMKLNRRRTAITFLGILFMVMLMTCVFAGRDTVVKYLENVAELDKGGWHVIAYDIDGEKAAVISDMDETAQTGYSMHSGYVDFTQSANSETPYLEIRSYTSDTFDLLNITPVEGRLPENEHEIVITKNAVEDGADVKIGDKISSELFSLTITGINPDILSTLFPFNDIELHYGETIEVPSGFPHYPENEDFREDKVPNGEQCDFTVVGIIQSPYFEKSGGAGYAAFTCMSDDAICNGSVNAVIKFDLDKVDSAYSFRQKLNTIAGKDIKTETNELLLAFSSKGSDSAINGLTIFIEIFFTVLIIAASLILIYNVFNMSYSERTKYLGMLSSVGATRRQKRWSIYYEMLYLLISALPLGILLGFAVIFGGMTALKPHIDNLITAIQSGVFPDIPVKLSVSAANLILIAAMSLVTVMISALIPAIKIGKIGPLECIRGSAVKKKKRYKTKFGFLEHGKAETLLAVSCTGRCRYLTKGIVRSIAVLGILAVVTLYGAGSVITLMEKKLDENDITYDVTGYNYSLCCDAKDDSLYNEVAAKISGDPAVTAVKSLDMISMRALIDASYLSDEYTKTFYELMDWYGVPDSDKELYLENVILYGADINLIALDDEDFKNVASKCGADMDIAGNSELPSIMLFNHREMSTDDYIFSDAPVNYRYFEMNNLYNVQKGDDISITMSGMKPAECEVKFAGFVDNDALKGLYKIKGMWLYGVINRNAYDMLIQAFDSVNTDQYRSAKEHTFLFAVDDKSDKGQALIREIALISEQSDRAIFCVSYDMLSGMVSLKGAICSIIRILAYCFTGLVSIICLLNMYNSVKGWAMERKRETAVLRSMGMTDRQLDKMHFIENLITLARGLVISAVFSAGFIILLDRAITDRFGNISLSVPWLMIVLIAVAISTASLLMTKLCYKNHGNSSIVEEIRNETV